MNWLTGKQLQNLNFIHVNALKKDLEQDIKNQAFESLGVWLSRRVGMELQVPPQYAGMQYLNVWYWS